MSTRVPLEDADAALERVEVDVLLVGVARGDRPLRGAAGRIDWRLCGRLSQLVEQGRVTGDRSDALLLGGNAGLRAPLVLVVGLGGRAELEPESSIPLLRDAIGRTLDLRADRVGVGLLEDVAPRLAAVGASELAGRRDAWRRTLETAAALACSQRTFRARLLVVGGERVHHRLADVEPARAGARTPRAHPRPDAPPHNPAQPFK